MDRTARGSEKRVQVDTVANGEGQARFAAASIRVATPADGPIMEAAIARSAACFDGGHHAPAEQTAAMEHVSGDDIRLAATPPGVAFHRAAGFVAGEPIRHPAGGVAVRFVPMTKRLSDPTGSIRRPASPQVDQRFGRAVT